LRHAVDLRVFTERRRRKNDPGGKSGLALARAGSKVLALDFDVQNALRLHFGVPSATSAAMSRKRWSSMTGASAY
jgi:hypothetical protein